MAPTETGGALRHLRAAVNKLADVLCQVVPPPFSQLNAAECAYEDLRRKWAAEALDRRARAAAAAAREKAAAEEASRAQRVAAATEASAKAEWSVLYSRHKVILLNELTGSEFERFLAELFLAIGYEVEMTPGGSDQGADLVLRDPGGERMVVQAKRYKQPVGNAAVQELLGGMTYYGCTRGLVVTTSQFTRSAKDLAAKHGQVALWDRDKLAAMHQQFLGNPPPFSMEAYNSLKGIERLRATPTRRRRQGRRY